MDKEAPSRGKKRSLFWIVLIVLVMMMGALGWQAKSLFQPPEPAPTPAPVWAKVPPAPAPTTIQIPQPSPDETITPPNADAPPEKPAIETPESMVAPKQAQDEKPLEPSDQTEQTAEVKTQEIAGQPDAAPTAPEPQKTTKDQPAQASAPAQPASASKQEATAEKVKKQLAPYTIQVGAFRVKTHANDEMAQLARKGYEPYILETTGANNKPWYGVRFGHFETRAQATRALLDYKAKEKKDGIISRSDSL